MMTMSLIYMKVNDYESTQIDIYQCIKITGTSCEDTSNTMTVDVSQLEMPDQLWMCFLFYW